MSFFDWLSSIFSPAVELVDNIHTSEEERLELKNELARIQELANSKLLDYEMKVLEARSAVQKAEASSQHLITAIWRPCVSVALVSVIILASFKIIPTPDSNFYELAKIILGGYVGGRSLEKVASVVKLGGK